MSPITVRSLERGHEYLLSHTRPVYDNEKKKFRPDRDRFLTPRILKVTYGGIQSGEPRHCWVCGRMGSTYHVFLRDSDFKEIYLSAHCIHHPSTKLWSPDCPLDTIENWYSQMFEEGEDDS